MKKTLFPMLGVISILLTDSSVADMTNDCKNLYVHQFSINPNAGSWITFKENISDGQNSASLPVNFNGWTETDRSAALSLVMMSISMGKKLDIQTNATGGCGITLQQRTLGSINWSSSN